MASYPSPPKFSIENLGGQVGRYWSGPHKNFGAVAEKPTQRSAKPLTPVRFRPAPQIKAHIYVLGVWIMPG